MQGFHRDTRERTTAEASGASSSTRDKHCQDSSGKKTQKSGLGKDQKQIPQCHFGGSLETAEDLAQQERQSQQDLQSKHRSKRQSLRPQQEENEGFGDSGILVLYLHLKELARIWARYARGFVEGQRRPAIRGNSPGTGLQPAR